MSSSPFRILNLLISDCIFVSFGLGIQIPNPIYSQVRPDQPLCVSYYKTGACASLNRLFARKRGKDLKDQAKTMPQDVHTRAHSPADTYKWHSCARAHAYSRVHTPLSLSQVPKHGLGRRMMYAECRPETSFESNKRVNRVAPNSRFRATPNLPNADANDWL